MVYYPGVYVNVKGQKRVLRGKTGYKSYDECCKAAREMWNEVKPDYPDLLAIDSDDMKPFTFNWGVSQHSYTRDKWHTMKILVQDKKGYHEPEVMWVIPEAYNVFKRANSKYRITQWKPTYTIYTVHGYNESGQPSAIVSFEKKRDAQAYVKVLEKYHWDGAYVDEYNDLNKTKFEAWKKRRHLHYADGYPDVPIVR